MATTTSSVLYVGETILLAHTATFDGTTLDDTTTESVAITIWDGTYASLFVAPTAMVWSGDSDRWEYWWDTDGYDAGKYNCRVMVTTTEGVSWEYFKVTLKADPGPAIV